MHSALILTCPANAVAAPVHDRMPCVLAGPDEEAAWLEGDPDQKRWRGGVNLGGRDCRAIVSYRCAECGLLRSYATEPVKAPGLLQP